MNKIYKGILYGIIAGIIDVTPMLFQKLSWDANLSAFIHWLIVGFLISTSTLKIKGVFKGLSIAILVLLPIGVIVGFKEPRSLIPMGVMTLILGGFLGWIIEKNGHGYVDKKKQKNKIKA